MKVSTGYWLLLSLAACVCAADAYKILVVFPFPAKSHSILGDGVVRHLAAAGHEITYITPIPKKSQPSNVRQIDVSTNFNLMDMELINIEKLMASKVTMDLISMINLARVIQNETFHNPNVVAILKNPEEHFDLVIAEWMFSELYCGFAAVFNTPYVWVSSLEPHWLALRLVDESLSPAYTADVLSSSVPPFSFYERVRQLSFQLQGFAIKYFNTDNVDAEIYISLGKYTRQRGRELPAYEKVQYNASLMLGNSHVSLGQAVALPQNYKSIGGYHIDTKLAPLPADLQKLLDNAKHGLIYFSMGSNLKSRELPNEIKRNLVKMFGTLKQTVLWKFEEVLPNLPSNVHITNWAPQTSVLAHPNCVMFITHGGLLSTLETIHYTKPIIGVPVYADQFMNVDRAARKGFAKRVDLTYNLAADLQTAIWDILQDPSYTNKVKELSFIYHDRPVTPGKELVHWVEHVIKTKGAPHLRSPALDMPFYQKMYLDLAALVLAVCFLIRTALRRILKRSTKKVKKN